MRPGQGVIVHVYYPSLKLSSEGSFRVPGQLSPVRSVAWTAAGTLIDVTEEDWDPSGFLDRQIGVIKS